MTSWTDNVPFPSELADKGAEYTYAGVVFPEFKPRSNWTAALLKGCYVFLENVKNEAEFTPAGILNRIQSKEPKHKPVKITVYKNTALVAFKMVKHADDFLTWLAGDPQGTTRAQKPGRGTRLKSITWAEWAEQHVPTAAYEEIDNIITNAQDSIAALVESEKEEETADNSCQISTYERVIATMLKKKATATEVPMQIRKANMYRDILGGTSQFFDPAEFLPHSLAAMRLAATTYEEYTPYLWDLGRDFVVGYDQGLPRAALVPNTVTDPKALAHFDDASSLWCEDLPSTVLPTDSAMVDYVGWDAVMTNTPAGQTNPVRTLARFEAHFVYRNLLEPDEDNVRPRDVACILDSGSRNPSIRMSDYSALTENVPLPFKGLRSRIPIGGHSPVPIPYVDLEMKILDWTQPTGTLMGWRSIEVDVETDPLAKPLSGNLPWKWLYTGSVPGSHKHDLLPRFVFGQTITSLRNNMKRPGPNNTSIPHAPATQQAIGWP